MSLDRPWQALDDETRSAAAERQATLWWRDDDDAEVAPALEHLLALAAAAAVPLALAVVPGRFAPGLAVRLADTDEVSVLQHGWRHANHARKGEGGWELGDHRPLAEAAPLRSRPAPAPPTRAVRVRRGHPARRLKPPPIVP